ncbi:MAG TPA: DUF4019 domain-containing protein [Candidatus Binataceae bacterium]|nr:DUF4019 domain-containing protein [Candidatus Binataceae bacterium]
MKRTAVLGAIILVFTAALNARGASDSTQAVEKAEAASAKWLALVDAGDYKGSWNNAAAYFKNAVSMDRWVQQVTAVRPPLGNLISRKVVSAKYATTLPGAPDGQYVVITYATSFANKKSATETVTPMLDPDGSWRVSGYFIR